MPRIELQLRKLHLNQQKIKDEAKRFNVVCCGRRFGKTILAQDLLIYPALKGFPVAYFSPTYKMLAEVWDEFKTNLRPLIKRKDEQLKKIELITGGVIDFWSLDNRESIRGRKYKRVAIDEFAILNREDAKSVWQEVIRPLLTDYIGDAFFFSTPKGINGYFYDLSQFHLKFDTWTYFQMPTSANPHISIDEINEAEKELDPITFRQEYLAEFTNKLEKPFAYCFEDRHISDSIKYSESLPLYLSFDFNVNPMSCILWQEGFTNGKEWIHYIDEISLDNSNIYAVCDVINSKYDNHHYIVTGDATGRSRHALSKENLNFYKVIKSELKLKDTQIKLPAVNPLHQDSQVLCNSILARHNEILIHPKCKELIADLRFVEVNDKGEIDKSKDARRTHMLDTFRYSLNSFHYNFITKK